MLTEELKEWEERLCAEPHCSNLRAEGYIYCLRCLHGTPPRAPEDVLRQLKRGRYFENPKDARLKAKPHTTVRRADKSCVPLDTNCDSGLLKGACEAREKALSEEQRRMGAAHETVQVAPLSLEEVKYLLGQNATGDKRIDSIAAARLYATLARWLPVVESFEREVGRMSERLSQAEMAAETLQRSNTRARWMMKSDEILARWLHRISPCCPCDLIPGDAGKAECKRDDHDCAGCWLDWAREKASKDEK